MHRNQYDDEHFPHPHSPTRLNSDITLVSPHCEYMWCNDTHCGITPPMYALAGALYTLQWLAKSAGHTLSIQEEKAAH